MIKSLAICGPTASGKTALSLRLAENIPLEIISLDSMQIYKGMDIGTAKATTAERARVKHHMLDIVSPDENYSAGKYREDALRIAKDISNRNKLPLFVGGTGLYLDSLMRSPSAEVPKSNEEYRDKLLSECDSEEKKIALWEKLCEVDKESAETIHYNNVRRVIRAIEVYEATGKPKSYFDRLSRQSDKEIDIKVITLDFHNRENLYKRVDKRAEQMFAEGLFEEVEGLYKQGLFPSGCTASGGIGYKEVISAINGEISVSEAKELVKQSSRRYAKRQLTWFRHIEERENIYLDDENGKFLDFEEVYGRVLEIARKVNENK